jgi:anti-anti-sigma regulatory factor
VLIEAHQRAHADARTIQLSNPSTAVSRLLEISGIDDYLNVTK